MSYHIYSTSGIVLKRTTFGESNAIFHILTRDFGLILASAQAVRSPKSKLSSALQEYSLILLSCIKGKNGWKITNASSKENFFFDYLSYAQRFISQTSSVLIRMMPGEEHHMEIFDSILASFLYLKNINNETEIGYLEILTIFRMMYLLGYISKDEKIEEFLTDTSLVNKDLLDKILLNKKVLVEKINKGLKESHL